ncbi:insulin-like growth factor-binding protein 6 [Myotis lucifugus]|uniref:insulin-like growth factor-binding protein 6 n=1 Tax=Myotis lucifugus TaxID=59463 RepID=UPI0006D71A57|nr:insulin-like growth factor-binding protein 6 [Myotis lucifugus]
MAEMWQGAALARCPGCGQGGRKRVVQGAARQRRGARQPRRRDVRRAGGCLRREGAAVRGLHPLTAPQDCSVSRRRKTRLLCGRCCWAGAAAARRARPTGGNPKESKPQVGTTRQQDTNRRDQQRNLGTSTTPARPNPGGVQDTEMGPCRKHLDSVLRQLQTEIFRGSQTLYVPNCDHRGFYRKRQCRSSQGQRRGPCWCVDRMGQPLPASADSNGGSSCSAGSSG